MADDILSAERVREVFDYDPETGVMRWREKISRKVVVGREVGTVSTGHRAVILNGIRYQVSRLAWVYMTGRWPEGEIRHIDGNGLNDRFSNLREAAKGRQQKVPLSVERVREILTYDPETGHFFRKVRTAQRHNVGDRADFLIVKGPLRGYFRVAIDSQRYLAHRVAWLYMHGEWPETIDHINGERSDNRIGNLRNGTQAQNTQNRRKAQTNCVSGFLGVHFHRETGRWCAGVQTNGVGRHIGLYKTKEEAHEAYLREKRKVHEFCSI